MYAVPHLLPIALGVMLLTTGCRQASNESADIKVELAIEPDPPKVGPATVTVKLRGADAQPVRATTLKLEGNMSHAGMEPVFADAKEEAPGVYRARMEFTMGGDWFILLDGKLADGRPLKKKIDVKRVRSD
jgi:hypothetical protein